MSTDSPKHLRRELGVVGATMLGLGSMLGTGVFVSIGVAAGAAGPSVIVAVALAALVATCNAFSSAQLAATHAVSGGTYEYGYRYLNHWLGFTAGWTFLCAKTASAATAALGLAGYLLHLLGLGSNAMVPVAVAASALLTIVVLAGMRRSNWMNFLMVLMTLAALVVFVAAGFPELVRSGRSNLTPFVASDANGVRGLLYATALMFVAYTGYARIATLGEEVKDPRRTIPRAIVATLVITATLYMLVGLVAVGAAGVDRLATAAASEATPLEAAAAVLGLPGVSTIVSIGAVTALVSVLLNLILGLSRVALAMGRQRDLPPLFARVNRRGDAPSPAVVAVGLAIGAVALIGNVETAWAFSAFTVLVYYAVTNLAALRLPREKLLYPRGFAIGGLAGCLFLAFWIPPRVWLSVSRSLGLD